jgi:hypothetical protein
MKKNNKGGNSDLHGKKWKCPNYIMDTIKDAVNKYEKNGKKKKTQGYKRGKGLIEDNEIEYKHMKRIKNWFDKFEGTHNDIEYKLNGGKTMHNWVDSTLNKERLALEGPKKVKSETGLANQFLKQHNKDNNKINKNSLKIRIPRISKDVSGQIWRGKPIYEEIKRMKKLITYKSKI